jgi:hypothetical chaperone protein
VQFSEARVHVDERITRADFEHFAAPLLDGLAGCVDELLARAQATPASIDAVFMTGGSSQIPSVRRLFAERFGEAKLRTADAFTSVAEGLGRAARHLD